jgi:hypothetical protein
MKTINDVLSDYAKEVWHNEIVAEAFPDPLQQRVEELEAALRPFVDWAKSKKFNYNGAYPIYVYTNADGQAAAIMASDLERAIEALGES